jgi:hypothetical protein
MRSRFEWYGQLVNQWREIVAQPLPEEERRETCLALLRDHVSRRAMAHVRDVSSLPFYAEMLCLRDQLRPRFANDDLGRIAIWPLYRAVEDWVQSHQFAHGAPRFTKN